MSRDRGDWIPWYCEDSPGWLELSLVARGAAEGIARKMGRNRSELHLGSRGLRGLATLLRCRWEELEPALAELLSPGPNGEDPRLVYDEERRVLTDPDHETRRRPSSAERVARHRATKTEPPGPPDVTPVTVTSVTSDSVTPVTGVRVTSPLLSSDLISSPADQDHLAGQKGVGAGASSAPPWFDDVLEVIAMDTGERLAKGEAWLRYAGHRASKRERPERDHAIYWLTTVMVQEAKDAREEAHRRRERDEQRDRARGAPPPPKPRQTPEEAQRKAQQLADRLHGRKGAA